MANFNFVETIRRHFDLSFAMLEKMIDQCPDELWNKKHGGFVFWQQLLHAFTGIHFWMRLSNEIFVEPFSDRKVYPELDQDPQDELTKNDLRDYMEKVKRICKSFFENQNDEWLNGSSVLDNRLKNIDIALMQIRHIQYHVGHCNSILREQNKEAVEWLDLFGE